MLFATDDWFAAAENLLKDTEPIFIADKFTDYGKWMDGWETRRKRIPGHDWCIIRLAAPCLIKGFDIDTVYFTGNYAPKVSIQIASLKPNGKFLFHFLIFGTRMITHLYTSHNCVEDNVVSGRRADMMGRTASKSDFDKVAKLKSDEWMELLSMTPLAPGYDATRHNYFPIDTDQVCTHIRVNIYPDGGIARLRVYGEVRPNIEHLSKCVDVDVIALQNGGACVDFSNAHYGHPRNLIKPGRGLNMGDGWETARRLDRPAILEADENGILKVPGNEWAVFELVAASNINSIEIDTNHFKGNFPDNVCIDGTMQNDKGSLASAEWTTILEKTKLCAHKQHYFKKEILSRGPFNFVRITIAPDGGVSRIRVMGTVRQPPAITDNDA